MAIAPIRSIFERKDALSPYPMDGRLEQMAGDASQIGKTLTRSLGRRTCDRRDVLGVTERGRAGERARSRHDLMRERALALAHDRQLDDDGAEEK